MTLAPDTLIQARDQAQQRLLDQMNADGLWAGRLSSSALAGAVACVALAQVDSEAHASILERGRAWIVATQNADGGWGDTPESVSNLSTTLLAWSALAYSHQESCLSASRMAEGYISAQSGGLDPDSLSKAILHVYGEDRTFSAPILALCALAGRLGPDPHCWKFVPQLPLEAAALPQGLFRFLQLPVVSYAIPALIGIGLLRHRRGRPNPVLGPLRDGLTPRLLRTLESIQPANGGFLEATPLTAFVTLSLSGAGVRDGAVLRRAVDFLIRSQREDGSWPIDTDLASWATTLAIKALEEGESILNTAQKTRLRGHLLTCQYRERHPFTGAAPGGWAWTHHPGAVPDADDTAGALLALHALWDGDTETRDAAARGLVWLMGLQNRDGGIPTFCKGWGKLPFDRSTADLTAHALRAFLAWHPAMDKALQRRMDHAIHRLIRFLLTHQQGDGSWLPLWFGHQQAQAQHNPLYGTAQVLLALTHPNLKGHAGIRSAMARAVEWMEANQNTDDGWGAHRGVPSSVEETALALSALAPLGKRPCLERGAVWLMQANRQEQFKPTPIGLYFASLWYDEALYPVIFTAQALRRLTFLYQNDGNTESWSSH